MPPLSSIQNNGQLREGSLRRDHTITVGTPSLLRAINERTVLELIHRQGPLSRAQAARISGLSKPTVSLSLTGLLESGLVREVGRSRGERGPSAMQYELNPLAGWGRHGLVEAVREELGTNVNFENDVNLAALAERAHGHGRNVSNFVFLSVGTGIGMALVIDGQLYRGAHGAAGEVAYMPLGMGDPHDPANRRRGAFEEAAAAAGVVRIARKLGMRMPLSPEKIFMAARRGHLVASRVVQTEAARLALAIATVTPVLDPELVILGGGIGRNGDLLLEPIERELRQLLPFRPRVAVSALGDDAVLQGAVAFALEAARERVFARRRGRQVDEAAE